MNATTDHPFAQSLTMWVSVYSMMRMDAGQPMTAFEILSALLAVAAEVIDRCPEEARPAMLQASTETLEQLCALEAEPAEPTVLN